jgi:YVTN family beta-propeller protein
MDSESKSSAGPASNNSAGLGGAGFNIGDGELGGTRGGDTSTTLPPEDKIELDVEIPKASGNYVYAANPDRNSVAIINPSNLAIQTVTVDAAPRGLQTLANRDAAIVVNTGSSTVSVLTTDSAGSTGVKTLPVMRGANVAVTSPDGKYALIYYDANRPSSGPLTDSPQNMSALDLSGSDPAVYQVTVGYHPTAVSFAADSSQAFVVSEDGISLVDLPHLSAAASRVSETIRVYDATVTTAARVWVSSDGNYAVAHPERSTLLRLVDLTSKQQSDLDLRSILGTLPDAGASSTLDVSDITLSPDGKFLLAVVRNANSVLRVPVPGGFEDATEVDRIELPNVLTGAVSIGPDGHYAVLYTTIDSQNEQRISILDLTGQKALQTINLHKLVDGVAFDPTGRTAYILHVKSLGDPRQQGLTQDQITARRYGYSMVDLASGLPKLQFTDSQPGQVTALPDGSPMFVLFPDTAPWSVQRVQLVGFAIESIGIGSQPTGLGLVSKAKQVFVSQAQIDGRMTFIDWETLKIRSVAGYELNSSIWE